MVIDYSILYPVLATLATDTLLWASWALEDWKFDSYEWKILVKRILKYGGVGVLMLFSGMSATVAIAAAGLLPVAEDLLKR